MNAREAHAWLTEQFSEFTTEADVLTNLWSLASAKRDQEKPLAGWKTWVRWCCKEARGEGVHAPVAVLRQKLQTTDEDHGPPRKRERPARSFSNQSATEYAEFKERAVRARTERPEPLPSSVAVTRLARTCGGYVKALAIVTKEWERQGRPYPEDFDPAPITQG